MSALPLLPELAPVRPRVFVAGGSVPRLLQEEVGELLARGRRELVCLRGASGSGRSTALRHLAAVFAGDGRLSLVDVGQPAVPFDGLRVQVGGVHDETVTEFAMAPWSDDDVLEYLLAAHRERAGAVLTIWRDDPFAGQLGPWPGLCRAVLDHLAAGRAAHVHAALHCELDARYPGSKRWWLATMARQHANAEGLQAVRRPGFVEPVLACAAVHALLTAENLLHESARRRAVPLRDLQWSPLLVLAVRRQLAAAPELEQALLESCGGDDPTLQAGSTSLLCAFRPGFRPPLPVQRHLSHAFLVRADLHGLRLCRLEGADLTEADLRGADLSDAVAAGARFRRARLADATLDGLRGMRIDASSARAPKASFVRAVLRDADFADAWLDRARLAHGNLAGACFAGASLRGADLGRANLERADLADADLALADCRDANLLGTDLRTAGLAGTNLANAWLEQAILSGTSLPGLQAPAACFANADLTGSCWQEANLGGANFGGAALAGVDWERADLRDADFTDATFHFGGTRSGLVGSPIAGEGSRTGFYTDESLEDAFQTPEEVRKANLRFCDLRGARVDGCDFYLVDLRSARLSPEQLPWLRKCRAILDRQVRIDGEGPLENAS